MRRGRHNLSMLTAFTSAPNHVRHPICKLLVWPRRAPKVNLPVQTQELNSALLKSPKSSELLGITLFTSPGLFSIWEFFYFDICEWHILLARAWTPALMLHITNPCTKLKVLILTKPKGKIYKTRSLRNYITPTIITTSHYSFFRTWSSLSDTVEYQDQNNPYREYLFGRYTQLIQSSLNRVERKKETE